MGRKAKFSKETKLLAIKQYQEGLKTFSQLANELGCYRTTVRDWLTNYGSMGTSAFDDKPRNKAYSKSFKLEVIRSYLNGDGSYRTLAEKYQIPSKQIIINWVLKYNRDIENKDYNPKGYVYMAKHRRVSYEEKLEIIKWTIENNYQYKLAAEKFETSYAQVYNWVKKYNASGEDGLIDNRGKRK